MDAMPSAHAGFNLTSLVRTLPADPEHLSAAADFRRQSGVSKLILHLKLSGASAINAGPFLVFIAAMSCEFPLDI